MIGAHLFGAEASSSTEAGASSSEGEDYGSSAGSSSGDLTGDGDEAPVDEYSGVPLIGQNFGAKPPPEVLELDARRVLGRVLAPDHCFAVAVRKCFEFLSHVASGAPELEAEEDMRSALGSWLLEPASMADLRDLSGSLATFWRHAAERRATLRPLAAVARRLLCLPATEAHCERVFSSIRRSVEPLGPRTGDATVHGRLMSRHG